MKERPILFSGEMVRAILDGRKTQTRRVVKEATQRSGDQAFAVCSAAESGWIAWFGERRGDIEAFTKKAYRHGFPCPYGKPGDRLWVKESYRFDKRYDHLSPSKAGGAVAFYEMDHQPHRENLLTGWIPGKLRPSIFMPRWASRITLEVTGVRVERLQDISEADAVAEGVRGYRDGFYEDYLHGGSVGTARASFGLLWQRINGAGSWAANPLVWVVEFRREGKR